MTDVVQGDCRGVMAGMEPDTFDSVVTDPPYEIGFMGRAWDKSGVAFEPDTWATVLRVLKPGGHLVAFGAPKNYHRLACAIEDAGFEVRDCLMWIFGQGFPKSKSLLKPAYEPILLARKPGPLLPLGIDACRVEASAKDIAAARVPQPAFNSPTGAIYNMKAGEGRNGETFDMSAGRWPANVVHDGSEEVLAGFPAQAGAAAPASGKTRTAGSKSGSIAWHFNGTDAAPAFYGDTGSAARFFYCAKAGKADRAGSKHPTVKPVALMRWLCRLVTPPGGLILDPFAGSGTTGQAAAEEGFRSVLIEQSAEYVATIWDRLNRVQPVLAGVLG